MRLSRRRFLKTPPGNYQKTYDFMMIAEAIEVNKFTQIHLMLEVKFEDNPLVSL